MDKVVKPKLVSKPKGRVLKKYTMKLGKDVIMSQPHIITIGHDPLKNAVQLNIQGRISFEEMIDMLNTCQYELINTFFKAASTQGDKDPLAHPIDVKKLKQDIYDKAVLGFSLMIDKFLPEAKNDKFAGMTDQAVMEAQNALLKKRAASKK